MAILSPTEVKLRILDVGGCGTDRGICAFPYGTSPTGSKMLAYRYIVTGRVQGVGYRYFALKCAETLGITGFVKNQGDGAVEVIAEGSEEALVSFEQELRKGPSFARVRAVESTPLAPRGTPGFHIR